MRTFVSVVPAPAAVAHLSATLAGLADRPGAPQWTPVERWHVTLAFLSEIDPDTAGRLTARLDPVAAAAAALRLSMSGVGTFPERGHPRVLWVGLAGDRRGLQSLARHVAIAARAARIRLERKPFQPHLTIGRWRGPADRTAAAAVVAALADYAGPVFTVDSMALVRSHLGPAPRHERLRTWPLATAEPT